MFRTKEIANELVMGDLEVADLIGDIDFLRSVDNALIIIHKKSLEFDSVNINKIHTIRRQLIKKIREVEDKVL